MSSFSSYAIMPLAGLAAGVLAGFLGVGGGVLLVPLLLFLGFSIDQATATSLLAILITASVGSWQNWRMGYLQPRQVLLLAFPAVALVVAGTEVGRSLPDAWRQGLFGLLLLSNLYLVSLKRRVVNHAVDSSPTISPTAARIATGGTAGFMAGLFGVGGGVVMVPLQLLLLDTEIKTAVRNSLGVIVITSLVASAYNFFKGDIVLGAGVSLGLGGLLGVQLSTRFLPRLPAQLVSWLFRGLLCLLAIYVFLQLWFSHRP